MFANELRYHRLRLPQKWQNTYDTIDVAVRQMQCSFEINKSQSSVGTQELHQIFCSVYNDNPSYYYYTPTVCQTEHYSDKFLCHVNYIYSEKQAKEIEQVLAEFLRDFYKQHVSRHMKDHEKVMLIHNYLVSTVAYDYSAESGAGEDLDVYNVLGALLKRRAVCWGISMAFKLLCDYLGVPSLVVLGKSSLDKSEDDHAWNIVRLGSHFYHVDATWDLRTKGSARHVFDHYNIDDGMMGAVHDWDRQYYPDCDGYEYNYFYMNNCFVSELGQIGPFLHRRLEQGKSQVLLKYRGDMPENDAIYREAQSAVAGFCESAGGRGVSWSVSINREMQNICVVLE